VPGRGPLHLFLVSHASALLATLRLPSGGRLILSAQPASRGSTLEALAAYRAAGAGLLISLLPAHELSALGLQSLAEVCSQADLRWAHCPIDDFAAPAAGFEAAWQQIAPAVHALLDRGGSVALHCRAGLGRTGTVAARVLLERGLEVQAAVDLVRQARPGAIETQVQEAYLYSQGWPQWPYVTTPGDAPA